MGGALHEDFYLPSYDFRWFPCFWMPAPAPAVQTCGRSPQGPTGEPDVLADCDPARATDFHSLGNYGLGCLYPASTKPQSAPYYPHHIYVTTGQNYRGIRALDPVLGRNTEAQRGKKTCPEVRCQLVRTRTILRAGDPIPYAQDKKSSLSPSPSGNILSSVHIIYSTSACQGPQ